MSPSEATNRATREEWRDLGFYYETRSDPPHWLFLGSAAGLARFVQLLDDYVADPKNRIVGEHEHYGPYGYLKIQTAEVAGIDDRSIRGSLSDLERLRDLVSERLVDSGVGQSFSIAAEYSKDTVVPLRFEVRASGFDPASADPHIAGTTS